MDDDLSRAHLQTVERSERDVFTTVAVGGEGTLESPLTSLRVKGPDTPDSMQPVSQEDQNSQSPRREFTVELPEVQAVRQQFNEQLAALRSGETALTAIGEAGRSLAEALHPGIRTAAVALGLDEEGADALATGFVEFIAGLPGPQDEAVTAGIETAFAALPIVGAAIKGGKIAAKAGPSILKEFEQAVEILKSERGSIPVPGGGGKPPVKPPPEKGAAGAGELGPIKRPRDPKIDALFEEAFQKAQGFEERVRVQRRGRMSDAELKELAKGPVVKIANKEDLTLESILQLPPGTTLPAEGMQMVKQALRAGHKAMQKSATQAHLANTEAAYTQLFDDLAQTREVLISLLGAHAESGRATRAMNVKVPTAGSTAVATGEEAEFTLSNPWAKQLYDFFLRMEQEGAKYAKAGSRAVAPESVRGQIPGPVMRHFAESVMDLQDEDGLAAFLLSLDKPVFWDVWQENWYNSMLTGLAPIKNLVGSPAIFAAEILNRGVSAGVDSIGTGMARWIGRTDIPRSVYVGEVGAMLHGVVESWGDALRLAWKGFTTGTPQTPGSSLALSELAPGTPQHYLFALEHNLPRASATSAYLGLTGLPGRFTDYLATLGTRFLVAGDEFNKAMAFRAELRALALRKAYQTVASEGLSGRDAAIRIQQIKTDVLTHPMKYHDEVVEPAQRFAAYITLQAELGKSGQAISEFANALTIGEREAGGLSGFPVGKALLPFTKIVTNAAKMAGEWTGPLSLISQAVRDEIAAGGARAATQMGKIATSTAFIAVMSGAAQNGLITGTGPRNKDAKRQWEAAGNKPLAVWDPIAKAYRSTSGLEPFNTILGAIADFHDIISSVEPGSSLETQAMIALEGLTLALANNLGSKSYLMGIVGSGNAVLSGDITSMDEYVKKTLPNLIIPYAGALRQIEQGTDPALRQAMTMLDHLKKNIPSWSETLPPERDALGKIMIRNGGWWNPWATGRPSEDADLWEVLNRHGVVIGRPEKNIDGVPLDDAWAYDAYVQAATDGLDEDLRNAIGQDEGLTDSDVERIVLDVVRGRRSEAKDAMRNSTEFPALAERLRDHAEKKASGEAVKPDKFIPGRLAPRLE